MAQNKNMKKSEGLCEKIRNAVSPFRPRIRRISDQPISMKNYVKNTSPQSKTIPVEFRHSSAAHFSTQNSKKESHDEREIKIIRGQKFAKSASGKEKEEEHVHFAKGKDEDRLSPAHEGKFSDYISKFRNRMMKTASHVGSGSGGGGGGGGNSTRRDSFNDKVTKYIDQAKIKIRTTTNVGVDQNNN